MFDQGDVFYFHLLYIFSCCFFFISKYLLFLWEKQEEVNNLKISLSPSNGQWLKFRRRLKKKIEIMIISIKNYYDWLLKIHIVRRFAEPIQLIYLKMVMVSFDYFRKFCNLFANCWFGNGFINETLLAL